MINTNILETALINKLSSKLTTDVVTEAFVRALPLNRAELTQEIPALSDYVATVLEALHVETLLDRALESHPDSILIQDLCTDIIGVSMEAASRIVKESAEVAGDDATLPDVVDKAEFTQAEMNKFRKSGSSVSLKEIGNIINKKVVDTIKAEKMEYEESEALKEKLSVALDKATRDNDNVEDESDFDDATEIAEDEDMSGESDPNLVDDKTSSLDSFMNTMFNIADVKDHLSLFSRLQEVSLESVLNTNEEYDQIPYELLKKITLESTLNIFDTPSKSIAHDIEIMALVSESYQDTEMSQSDFGKNMNTSMLCAICIYTLMETLKTMKLYNPAVEDVKKFVDRPMTMSDAVENNIYKIKNRIDSKIADAKKIAKESTSVEALNDQYKDFGQIRKNIALLPPEYDSIKDDTLKAVESAMTIIKDRAVELNKAPDIVQESAYTTRDKEVNVAAFSTIARNYGKHPSVSEVRIVLDRAKESVGVATVDFYNQHGVKIDTTLVSMRAVEAYNSFEDCVLEAARLSTLTNTGKNLNVYHTDTCKLSPLL